MFLQQNDRFNDGMILNLSKLHYIVPTYTKFSSDYRFGTPLNSVPQPPISYI